MPYAARHLKLSFGGKLLESETWSCGLRVANAGGPPPIPPPLPGATPSMSELQEFCVANIADVASEVRDYWAALGNVTNSAAKLEWVKLNPVDTDGKQDASYGTVAENFTGIAGGSSGNQFPQLALAVSTMTGLARGRAHTGRWYLPLGSPVAMDFNGNITSAVALAAANATAAFINDVNNWPGLDPLWEPNVCVMSNLDDGVTHRVTSVRVGRTIDTQRRRRNQIPELYVPAVTAIT